MPTEESYCSPHLLRDPSSPELAGPAADIRNPIIIGAHLRLLDIRLSGRNLFFRHGVMVRYSSKRPPRLRSMKTLHILIVEDEPWVAMDLEMIIIKIVTATVVIEGSIAATKEALHEALDFAFLDVDVTNGKTFEIAHILERKHVPFVFVSGSPQDELPFELRSVPFIPKPFDAAQIESALQAVAN